MDIVSHFSLLEYSKTLSFFIILPSLTPIAFDSVGRTAGSPETFCHGFAKEFYKKECVGRSNDKKAFHKLLREKPPKNEFPMK